jgi:hypothetical protein
MVNIAPRCTNEESTNPILILPFLNFLGYDDRNPDEVCPEHGADFSEKYKNRVDFAILKGCVSGHRHRVQNAWHGAQGRAGATALLL